jgi:hypothetical protein
VRRSTDTFAKSRHVVLLNKEIARRRAISEPQHGRVQRPERRGDPVQVGAAERSLRPGPVQPERDPLGAGQPTVGAGEPPRP